MPQSRPLHKQMGGRAGQVPEGRETTPKPGRKEKKREREKEITKERTKERERERERQRTDKQAASRGDLEGMLRKARMRQANVHDCPRADASETVAACLLRLGSPCIRRPVVLAASGRSRISRSGSKLDMVYRHLEGVGQE